MPRPRNQLPTVELRLKVPPQLREALECLVETGMYGSNVNDAAVQLIFQAVNEITRRDSDIYAPLREKQARAVTEKINRMQKKKSS